MSFVFLQQLVLLFQDKQIVFLHSVQQSILRVAHQFDLGIGALSDRLDLQVLIQQLALN